MRTLSKSNRTRLLRLASWLDGRAVAIRAFVKSRTPKRKRSVKVETA